MTVQELIAELKLQDPKTPVFFSWAYGDYNRTDAAEEVSTVEELYVKEWAYANCHKVVEDVCFEEMEDSDETTLAVVIRG